MNGPLKVEVVRPYQTGAERFAAFLARTGIVIFAAPWVLMLVVPLFSTVHPTYWHAFWFLVAARLVLPDSTGYLYWTRQGKKPGAR